MVIRSRRRRSALSTGCQPDMMLLTGHCRAILEDCPYSRTYPYDRSLRNRKNCVSRNLTQDDHREWPHLNIPALDSAVCCTTQFRMSLPEVLDHKGCPPPVSCSTGPLSDAHVTVPFLVLFSLPSCARCLRTKYRHTKDMSSVGHVPLE